MTTLNSKRLIINRLFRDRQQQQHNKNKKNNITNWPTQDSFYVSRYQNQISSPISFAFESNYADIQNKNKLELEAKYFQNFNHEQKICYRPVNGSVFQRPLKRSLYMELMEIQKQQLLSKQQKDKLKLDKKKESKKHSSLHSFSKIYQPNYQILECNSKKAVTKLVPNKTKENNVIFQPNCQIKKCTLNNQYFSKIGFQNNQNVPNLVEKALISSVDKKQLKQSQKSKNCKKGVRTLREYSSRSHENLHDRNIIPVRKIQDFENQRSIHKDYSLKAFHNNLQSFKCKKENISKDREDGRLKNYLLKSLGNQVILNRQNKENLGNQNIGLKNNQKSQDRLKQIRVQLHKIYSTRLIRKDQKETKSLMQKANKNYCNNFGKIKKNKSNFGNIQISKQYEPINQKLALSTKIR